MTSCSLGLRAYLLALVTMLVVPTAAIAGEDLEPHPHQGKVKPFGVPPDSFPLQPDEVALLAAGKAVRKTLRGDAGGRGLAVMDVAAPPAVVWSIITDYPSYPRMVENVRETQVYERRGEHIKARFVISGGGVSIEYFVDHIYRPEAGYMTWTLDYTRKSEMDDSVGFWRVAPHPDKPGHSRIFYSIEIRAGWWVPSFIEDMLAKDGLVKSTSWVKREAEARHKGAAVR
ncbi:MAG: SRPBCC family protein [Myxococcota bacterium]